MGKKKGGKGKGKKKGKKKGNEASKKGKLSHLERETYLLTIADLLHKIEWRNHLCNILEEDIELYGRALEREKRDKEEGVALLKDAVLDQREACQRAERALPDAQRSRKEEGRGRELASKLVQANEEAMSYEAQLRTLRRKLKSLETYDADRVDEKIRDLEERLRTEDEDAFLRGREQDRRRVEAFRREMLDILAKKAEKFQDKIGGRLDEHFVRISEEARWRADTAHRLRTAAERLRCLNDAQARDLRDRRRKTSLPLRKEEVEPRGSSKVGNDPQTREPEVVEDPESMREEGEGEEEEVFHQIERKESDVKVLENRLKDELLFGRQLSSFVGRAVGLLSAEAELPLVVTHDGPPKEKRTLAQLRRLLEEAARFICERKGHRSVLL